MRVGSVEQCELLCAIEFERHRDNRFVGRGFVHCYAWDIAREGDIDVRLRSEHDD